MGLGFGNSVSIQIRVKAKFRVLGLSLTLHQSKFSFSCRYVGYWVKNHGLELPESTPVRITELSLRGCMNMGKEEGSDFLVSLDQGRGNTVFSAHFGNNIKLQGREQREQGHPGWSSWSTVPS